tara:strand:+ start:280 stop:489 length:210 start_codon:yes stop_codon:yes gene_type:complete
MCIERNHPKVSVRRQCQMLLLAPSNLYYAPKGESAENLRFMELIDKQFLETVSELRHRFEQRWRRYGSR